MIDFQGDFFPDIRLEILLCRLSVLLNPKIVDQRGSGGVDKDVEDVEDSVDLNQDQDGADGLQHPVDQVELHRHEVSVLPQLSASFKFDVLGF